MAWLGIISLGMAAELSMIILLGRAQTQRYEAAQEPLPHTDPDRGAAARWGASAPVRPR